jgi:hypothetical protein
MKKTNLICYEEIYSTLHWKYKSYLKDDFEIIKVSDIKKKIKYCTNSRQFIMSFVDMLKHHVIRLLPNINKVKLMIGVFDKNNILHRIIVDTYNIICNILKYENKNINYYKTIFIIIKYEDKIVFMGNLEFTNI